MKTQTIAITKLQTNNGQIEGLPKNPRFIRDARFEALKKSIQDLPSMLDLRELIVVPQNGHFVTVGGNMRLRAAKDLGFADLPCKILDADTPIETLAEIAIKDNVGFGQDDYDLIANEWTDFPLADWGLEIPELDLSGDAPEEDEAAASEAINKAAELQKKWKTASGQLWKLGEHRLICGDCTDKATVAKLMSAERFDLCVTSPPYNSGDGGYKTDYNGKTKRFYQDNTDDRTESEWVEFCEEVLLLCSDYVRDDMTVIAWNVMYNARCRSGYGQVMFRGGHPFTVKETICWDKGHGFPSASKGILSRNWELIFILSKGKKYNTTQGENEPRWCKWDIARPDEQAENHKATFPVALPERAIDEFSFNGSTVYDPFSGSGTTLAACENKGRTFRGCELSPEYVAVALERWHNLTGKRPELIEDAEAARG